MSLSDLEYHISVHKFLIGNRPVSDIVDMYGDDKSILLNKKITMSQNYQAITTLARAA